MNKHLKPKIIILQLIILRQKASCLLNIMESGAIAMNTFYFVFSVI